MGTSEKYSYLHHLVAQAAQVAQLKHNESGIRIDTLRISPPSSQNSVFTPAYPSPPPSVIDASKVSSPMDRSPEVACAKVTPTPPMAPPPTYSPPSVSDAQNTPPISPQQRAVRFRDRGPPIIHCQTRFEKEAISPTSSVTGQAELSSVDNAWGLLFDPEGFGTQRLNSVLRGLANYMARPICASSLPRVVTNATADYGIRFPRVPGRYP